MTSFPWLLYAITALLSMIWAATEVISAFEATPIRALFTWGTLVLMLANAFFACLALMTVLQLMPDTANNLLTAFIVGFGWQALVRSQVKLFRPLPGEPGGEGLTLPVDEVYGRIQQFVRRSIDQSLARRRMGLLTDAMKLDTATLRRHVRLLSYGITEMDPGTVENWFQQMDSRQMADEERKILLASKIIEASGIRGLKELIKSETKQTQQPATAAPTPTASSSLASDGAGGAAESEEAKPAEPEPETTDDGA